MASKSIPPSKAAKQKKMAIGSASCSSPSSPSRGRRRSRCSRARPTRRRRTTPAAGRPGRRRPPPRRRTDARRCPDRGPPAGAGQPVVLAPGTVRAGDGQLVSFERSRARIRSRSRSTPAAVAETLAPPAPTEPLSRLRRRRARPGPRRHLRSQTRSRRPRRTRPARLRRSSRPRAAKATTLAVNGVSATVDLGKQFPADERSSTSARWPRTTSGQGRDRRRLLRERREDHEAGGGKPMTLVNTADGTRYSSS